MTYTMTEAKRKARGQLAAGVAMAEARSAVSDLGTEIQREAVHFNRATGTLTTEASTAGLTMWPSAIRIKTRDGRGVRLFHFDRYQRDMEEEIVGAYYRGAAHQLLVIND